MTKLIDQSFLLILLFFLLPETEDYTLPVVLILSALAFIGIQSYLTSAKAKDLFSIVILLSAFFYAPLFLLSPFAFYQLSHHKKMFYLPFFTVILLFYHVDNAFFTMQELLLNSIFCFLALYLGYQSISQKSLQHELRTIRDESTEKNLKLAAQNKEIMKKQDYEIHLATLSERNRIAREIHDNVGHMLSRTILQIGALMVVYRDSPFCQQLESIHATLDQAMTSIRESVHDLHDDAIDLKMSIRECIKDIESKFQVSVDYDISSDLTREIKYCMISVIKEALSNAVKHSDGNRIKITVREHPGFYQLSIADNGSCSDRQNMDELMSHSGIGISNMKQRVEALEGTFRIHNEKGFQIFVSLPRKGE